MQLGRLAGLEMYGTCSSRGALAVSDLGAIPIDYQHQDFVKEIRRLTREGVDVVFDGSRHRYRGIAIFRLYIAGGWLLPSRNLIALLDLLKQQKIKPLIAQRFPLVEARHAHELLGKGGVTGKIVLVRNGSSLESGAA